MVPAMANDVAVAVTVGVVLVLGMHFVGCSRPKRADPGSSVSSPSTAASDATDKQCRTDLRSRANLEQHFPVAHGGVAIVTTRDVEELLPADDYGLQGVLFHDCGDNRTWWVPSVPCKREARLVDAARQRTTVLASRCFEPERGTL